MGKRKLKSYKNVEVGGLYETNNFGVLEVLSIDGPKKSTVRFVDTGYTAEVELGSIRSGQVKDWSNTYRESAGKEFPTVSYGDITILEYKNAKEVLVKFNNTGNTAWFTASNISVGRIYDCMAPIAGGGFIGVGPYSAKGNYKAYHHWHQMLIRCSSDEHKFRNYFDKEIVDEWLCFQVFAPWAESQVGFDKLKPKWQLDKDILVQGNKIYGPDTCCFIPHRINSLVIKSNPEGFWSEKDNRWYFSYREYDSTKVRKGFINQEDGFAWYTVNKERVVKEVADLYKNELDSRVYEALYSWQVK